MGDLWYSIGASPAYEIFTGCAEVLAGILLIFPRTTVLGALLTLMDLIMVFMLNMTYDVPVKLFSFHLLLMALFLLGPDISRLFDFFLRDRTSRRSRQTPLFGRQRANHIALIAQVVFWLYLVGANIYGSWTMWFKYGEGPPRPALYGIWTVDQMSVNGQARPLLLTDDTRWHRVIFDVPERVSFQHMDEKFQGFGPAVNERDQTLTLTKDGDKNWKGRFKYERPTPNRLILDGVMDSKPVQMQLQLIDRNQYLLVSRGFHWISEYPFNR
jgi:hypothetical protein